jgi:quercetin dioxygenase-like cupin family protein
VELASERPVLLRPGEGQTIFDQPERTIRILADRDELALTWFRYEPGQEGPEPHVHRQHTDAFYVLEGELELGLGPALTWRTGPAGTLAAAPRNVVHTFRNSSDATVVFLNIHAPSMGFAEMLRAARDGRDADDADFDQFEVPADGGRPLSDAVFRTAGEGNLGIIEGFLSLTETTLEQGFQGPLLRRHRAPVDCFYVVDGTLSLRFADEWIDVGPGTFGFVPEAYPHTFATRSEKGVRMLCFTSGRQLR